MTTERAERCDARPIDVWNAGSFDADLLALLRERESLVRGYLDTEIRIFREHDLGRAAVRSILRPKNPFAAAYLAFAEELAAQMTCRAIRAFHYTRLTDAEVDRLRQCGIELSTPESLCRRLSERAAEGLLTQSEGQCLFAASPFQGEQLAVRQNRFWMTSHPTPVSDTGVEPLMLHWGGEVTYMHLQDEGLLRRVRQIGTPRIVEVSLPLEETRHSHSATEAVIATFGRSVGCIPDKKAFDVCAVRALPPCRVLAVHSPGERAFADMGVSYPLGFVDVAAGRWKELTGEDD